MGEIVVRVHKSYRWVVAVCDADVRGRQLSEGSMQLDLSGRFFEGDSCGEGEAREKILDCVKEDATFNIVGKDSVRLAMELGIVKEEGVREIEGVPFALVLL